MALIEKDLERAPNFRPTEIVMMGCDDPTIVEWVCGLISVPKTTIAENQPLANQLQDLCVQLMTRFPWVMEAPEISDPTLDPYDYATQFISIVERSVEE